MVVASTAKIMNVFIAGMAISGVGAGINELTALAVTAEIAPTRKRGLYVSLIVFTILPYCPCQLWAQLVASKAGWRYIGLWCGLWAFVGLVMTVVFYHPPPRVNTVGMSRKEVLARIDYIGGVLSVSGLLLFMVRLRVFLLDHLWMDTSKSRLTRIEELTNLVTDGCHLGRLQLPLEIDACSCASSSRCRAPDRFLRVGSKVRKIPNVPTSSCEREEDSGVDLDHHSNQVSDLSPTPPVLVSKRSVESNVLWTSMSPHELDVSSSVANITFSLAAPTSSLSFYFGPLNLTTSTVMTPSALAFVTSLWASQFSQAHASSLRF